MQIIYDSKGTIFLQGSGYPTPDGNLKYLETSVPANHYIESIDVSKDPAEPILKEYPKSEMDQLKETLEQQQANLDYLMLLNESTDE